MTEQEMREVEVPTFDNADALAGYIKSLVEREHDYGTCVYAVSMAATAAFNFVARALGVTGFQASCADMDVLRRTSRMKHGFAILDYADLLYPQCRKKFDRLKWDRLIANNINGLSKAAALNLEESPNAHPDVVAHWKDLVAMGK